MIGKAEIDGALEETRAIVRSIEGIDDLTSEEQAQRIAAHLHIDKTELQAHLWGAAKEPASQILRAVQRVIDDANDRDAEEWSEQETKEVAEAIIDTLWEFGLAQWVLAFIVARRNLHVAASGKGAKSAPGGDLSALT